MIFEAYGLSDKILCDEVIRYFASTKERTESQLVDFFSKRTLSLQQIICSDIGKKIKILQHKISQELYRQYQEFVFLEFCDIVHWTPGMSMNVHTDNTSGFDINRHYTTVFYLNDDYSGGETFLPEHNFICKPEKGKLLAFPSDYPHGVNEIRDNSRYTLMMWFTKNENSALIF